MNKHTVMISALGLGCIMTVGGCMEPVVARAGNNRTVEGGDTVTLDGSGSLPRDPNRIEYLWEVIDGPEVTLAEAKARGTTFTAPRLSSDSTVVVQLTVTYVDLSGLVYPPNRDTDSVRIRVKADPDATEADLSGEDADLDNDDAEADTAPSDGETQPDTSATAADADAEVSVVGA